MKINQAKKHPGIIDRFILQAPKLHSDKNIWVYLPYNYYAYTEKKYPVIYMHDGQNVFDDAESAKKEWHAEEKLNNLHLDAIIVGIENGGNTYRIDEMTPYKNDKYGGGHADDYLDFIIHILKLHIDGHYRTLTDKENTTIFGASVGGLISFYALLKFPDIFGNAGVFSPSFWFNDEIYKLAESINLIEGRIYFLAGDHESNAMVPDLERMEKLVREKVKQSKQVYKKIVHNGHHNEKLWRKEFPEACIWLIGHE